MFGSAMPKPGFAKALCAAVCLLSAAASALAQDAIDGSAPTGSLKLELNSAEQIETSCRLIFMTRNDLGGDLDELSFETVLFDTEGTVERFTLFAFRDVPAGRIRVRQFDLPDTQCASIGRVLINGASTCNGEGVAEVDCTARLETTTRIDMELSG